MLTYASITLGCKVNQYDSAAVAQLLASRGYRRTPERQANLLVINTCCVTASAAAKSRYAIRRALTNHSPSFVLVLGCYCDYDAAALARLLDSLGVAPDARAIIGQHNLTASACEEFLAKVEARRAVGGPAAPQDAKAADQPSAKGIDTPAEAVPQSIKTRRGIAVKAILTSKADQLPTITQFPAHRRAFVKVQDGCDAFCSYCIVPFTRCHVRSRPEDEILAECAQLVRAGHREIVLCGVFLGAYGQDTAIRRKWTRPSGLARLVRQAAAIDGLWRVRLSSLEPLDVTDELLDVLAGCPKVAPHLHLPLQSGAAAVLARMNRQYTPGQFIECVRRLGAVLDRPAITTDIIVGFPAESDDDFDQTLELARQAGFSKIHAFPFSPIEPTAAWHARHLAPPQHVVRRRLEALAQLDNELAGLYRRQFIGQAMPALVNQTRRRFGALTDRHLQVALEPPPTAWGRQPHDLAGRVVKILITGEDGDGLRGRLADDGLEAQEASGLSTTGKA